MPNKWIEHAKNYAKEKGVKYSEALTCPECKSSYKTGGKITTQNGQKVSVTKMGFGMDAGREDDKSEAVIYNQKQLGANGGKKFISL